MSPAPALVASGEAPAGVIESAPPAAMPPKSGESASVAVSAKAAEGLVKLAIAPWGEVHVDGRMLGVSPPLNEIRLPAGRHRVEIRNAGFSSYSTTIDLAGNGSLRLKHKFE